MIPATISKGAKGKPVGQLQTLLNRHGAKIKNDHVFGAVTAKEVKVFQKAHGLKTDAVVGPRTWNKLMSPSNVKPTSTVTKTKAAKAAVSREKKVRANMAYVGHFMLAHADKIHYPAGDVRTESIVKVAKMSDLMALVARPQGLTIDCSQSFTLAAHVSGAKCPNGGYASAWRQDGYTGTLKMGMQEIDLVDGQPGDAVMWLPPSTGHHVAWLMEDGVYGNNAHVFSQGSENGPFLLTVAAESAAQRGFGARQTICLRLPV